MLESRVLLHPSLLFVQLGNQPFIFAAVLSKSRALFMYPELELLPMRAFDEIDSILLIHKPHWMTVATFVLQSMRLPLVYCPTP